MGQSAPPPGDATGLARGINIGTQKWFDKQVAAAGRWPDNSPASNAGKIRCVIRPRIDLDQRRMPQHVKII
jgi:hypothetical protein